MQREPNGIVYTVTVQSPKNICLHANVDYVLIIPHILLCLENRESVLHPLCQHVGFWFMTFPLKEIDNLYTKNNLCERSIGSSGANTCLTCK